MEFAAMIMAGGTGTRFWPLSRRERPKQVLSLAGGESMLASTIERLRSFVDKEKIYVITAREHQKPVRQACSMLPEQNILGEPEGRDTAACVGWGSLVVEEIHGPDTVIGVFPADHRITPVEEFTTAARSAAAAARKMDSLVTFGINPEFPSTGYGYIQYETEQREEFEGQNVHPVRRFTEKPGRDRAKKFINSGDYLWNSGMFFWTARRIKNEIESYLPELAEGLGKIRKRWRETGSWPEATDPYYGQLPEISVDYGILENSERIWTLPVDFTWGDLGTWDALDKIYESDEEGNICRGDVQVIDSSNSIVFNEEGPFVGVVGAEDLVVVSTDDAVLVCPREKTEEVKKLVNRLEDKNREELL
ncbi:MAG: mannose-1-phosphate guanylyltransferase [bacterium]